MAMGRSEAECSLPMCRAIRQIVASSPPASHSDPIYDDPLHRHSDSHRTVVGAPGAADGP